MFKTYLLRALYPVFAPDEGGGGGSSEGGDSQDSSSSVAQDQGIPEVSDTDLMGTPDEKSAEDDADGGDDSSDDKDDSDDANDKTTSDDDDSKSTDNSDDDQDKDDDDTGDDKSDTEKKAEPSDSKSDKPPKGFVPTSALHEARDENRFLKDQINDLKDLIIAAKDSPGQDDKEDKSTPDDFEVLSKEDFKTLSEDNPAAALTYMMDLNNHNAKLADTEKLESQKTQNAEQTQVILDESADAMEKAVPGIFDEDGEVHDALIEFAGDLGFSSDMFYLTNPATQIILPGESEPLLLGDQAASILGLLATARTKIGDAKTAVDEKALEAKIRKDVEAELILKFKKSGGKEFRSIHQAPKSKGGQEFGDKILSDAAFAKLSSEDQEAYLAGA